jgi:steroid 5-alpha reductase family enzyme
MLVDHVLPAAWAVVPAGVLCLDVCLALALGCFLVSVVTDNYSQVDKLWSITPWLYVWLLVANGGLENQRLMLMAIASLVWGMRLTLNFARRGGYVWPKVWEGEVGCARG